MTNDNTQRLFDSFDDLCHLMNNLRMNNSFSLIEKDLVLEKLRNIYLAVSKEIPEKIHKIIESPEKQMKIEKMTEPVIQETDTTDQIQEAEMEQNTEIHADKEVKQNITEASEKIKKEIAPERLGEKYQGSKHFMNEHISKHHQSQDISNKLQSRPIEDIGKAIGLNEKFLFINELFHGDSSSYKKTIEMLNNCHDFNEAFSYIEEHLNWNLKEETTLKFIELLRRKYISPAK